MTWLGKWRNQYGSVLEITNESEHGIVGKFRTALEDSGFFGQEISVFIKAIASGSPGVDVPPRATWS